MTVYPFAIDSDQTIIRVDDNITEVGGDSINQLREAVFAVEEELGISPSGSAGSLANRFNVAHNADGSIRASALVAVGLATLPIVDNQVAFNAGIKEYKLSLDFTTSDLHTAILSNEALLNSLNAFSNSIFSDLHLHIAGATLLSDGSASARHVLSNIDVNATPSDSRDPSFTWPGLKDKTGVLRTAKQAAKALQQINDDLVSHENSIAGAHVASAITIDTSGFIEIPSNATDAQQVFNYLDEAEVLNIGQHRATQHSNGVPKKARSRAFSLPDGYRENVVPPTAATTYLIHAPNTGPVDDLSTGDDLIKFKPNNTNFVFDALFSQVRIGDIIRVNYGNGIEASFPVESLRYVPNGEWIVRINGVNLFETQDGYASARIDRAIFDTNTVGVLALASANASGPSGPGPFSSILSSVIVGHPQGATALGLGFDPGQLNSTHYNLYLEFYPTGKPTDRIISMPAIDVTSNAGTTSGSYTLENVVAAINNNFREIGFNYRFIAFSVLGEIGIMLADAINGASFAIVSGNNSSGTLVTGSFVNNVIGGNSIDDFDALGFGPLGSGLSSPAYQGTWTSSIAAQLPTKVIPPLKNRNYIVNGQRKNTFVPTYLANVDGYWDGYISARNPVGIFTVEVTYTIELDLEASGLKAGKTIVVQPAVDFSNGLYNDVDYGRFIIKNVIFKTPCGSSVGSTEITVINGLHAAASGFGFSSAPSLPVRLYFSDDSVSFNFEEIIDQTPTASQLTRFHEIYINDKGHTFSHERARLSRQVEDTHKLNTFNLHLKNVSPKLRGYRGSDPLVYNKFLRLYVLSYDTTSGAFDGYLGKISGANDLIFAGPISTGRKNVVTRLYDETGIDFIDIMFEETSPSPGVNILSTAAPRYVDIELFSSLQTDDEFMVLGTCEVNWQPAGNQFIVQSVRDGRQFGSISESDFTSSALDFISAGDRFLHENGVIQGLTLDSIGINGEIFFKGGMALVNGRITTVNNMAVTIPQISQTGSSLPQTLTWAVCVNQSNNLVPILLTSTEQQFFATPGAGNYYVQSATLSELVNTRKDLTPIAIATVIINSITVSNVKDVRRFITSSGLNNYLTWTSDDQIIGHFRNFESLSTWINNYNVGNIHVQIKGNFDISSPVDFTILNKGVIFDGLGSVFNVTSGDGFMLGSNVKLQNITFNYNPTGLLYNNNSLGTFPDLINSGNGCVFLASGVDYSNIAIENCIFNCATIATQRPPFIGGELIRGQNLTNLIVRNCLFNDGSATGKMAALAIIGIDNATLVPNAVINAKIEHNICNRDQGIYITSISSASAIVTPGVNIISSIIANNTCGIIGYCTSSISNTSATIILTNDSLGLTVTDNDCHYIATTDHTGVSTVVGSIGTAFGTGRVVIKNNFCNWIHVYAQDNISSNQYSSLSIRDNTMTSYDYNFVKNPYLGGNAVDVNSGIKLNTAIIVYLLQYGTSGNTIYQVTNNDIGIGVYNGTTYSYDGGIASVGSASIQYNIIKGLALNSNGILVTNSNIGPQDYWIQNNKIYRTGSISINSFINATIGTGYATITDNFFNLDTIDSSFLDNSVIKGTTFTWVVNNNVGQTVSVNVEGDVGFLGVRSASSNNIYVASGAAAVGGTGYLGASSILDSSALTGPVVIYKSDNTAIGMIWSIPLESVIPIGAYLTKVSFSAYATTQFSGNATLFTYLRDTDNFVGTGSESSAISTNFGTPGTYAANTVVPITITVPYGKVKIVPNFSNGKLPKLIIKGNPMMDAGAGTVNINAVTITYRW